MKSSPYYLPEHEYLMTVHFCLSYKELKREYAELTSTYNGINMDGMPHGNGISDPTARNAIRRAKLAEKIDIIEHTAEEVGEDLYEYLLMGVTEKGMTYEWLREKKGMPCGKNEYYTMRKKYYKEIFRQLL